MEKRKPSFTRIQICDLQTTTSEIRAEECIPPFHLNSPYNCSISVCLIIFKSLYAIQLDTFNPVTRLLKLYPFKSKAVYQSHHKLAYRERDPDCLETLFPSRCIMHVAEPSLSLHGPHLFVLYCQTRLL